MSAISSFPPVPRRVTRWEALVYLAARPAFYPELVRRVRVNLGRRLLPPPMGQGRQVAEAWAAELACTSQELIGKLFPGRPFVAVDDAFRDAMRGAQERMRACPVPMHPGGGKDLLYNIAAASSAGCIVETGVAYGVSSLMFLLALEPHGGDLISVDMPYPGRGNEEYVGCAVPQNLRTRWQLLRAPDYVALPKALAARVGQVDIAYYDSDKTYEGRAWAYPRLWSALRHGGCLISDDIGDNTAFRDFCGEVGGAPVVVDAQDSPNSKPHFIGILVKADR